MTIFTDRTPGDVVAEIAMSRSAFRGSFLVVEGGTDCSFFSRRIAPDSAQLVIGGGKCTVCAAVIRAYAEGHVGIVGAIDDDYDSLAGVPIPSMHLVRTDARDIEAMLIRSNALEAVLHEVANPAKLAAFQTSARITARDALMQRGLLFGCLRFICRQSGWQLAKGAINPYRFLNEDSWELDANGAKREFCSLTGVSEATLESMLAAALANDPYRLIHGRDTLGVLAVGLRRRLGEHRLSAESLARMLRLAFDDSMASGTAFFGGIRGWETANPPFRVLR